MKSHLTYLGAALLLTISQVASAGSYSCGFTPAPGTTLQTRQQAIDATVQYNVQYSNNEGLGPCKGKGIPGSPDSNGNFSITVQVTCANGGTTEFSSTCYFQKDDSTLPMR